MANYPLVRCRFGCGKESTRPGWIVHAHEPECHLNPNNSRMERAKGPLQHSNYPVVRCRFGCGKESDRPGWIVHTHELECHLNPNSLPRRCSEYEITIKAMTKEQDRLLAELERTRRELQSRRGCLLCNADLLPVPVREAIVQEIVKIVSQKHDVVQQVLSSVLVPTTQTEERLEDRERASPAITG